MRPRSISILETLSLMNPVIAGKLEVCKVDCERCGMCAKAINDKQEGCPMTESELEFWRILDRYLRTGYV